MMKALRKKRKIGNKGFSLVELIIVIAIMAVLVAILAPQYLKYVEKSRVAVDEQFAEELKNAVQIALAEEAIYEEIEDGDELTWSGAIASTDAPLLLAEVQSSMGDENDIQSKEYADQMYTVTITITADYEYSVDGNWGPAPVTP